MQEQRDEVVVAVTGLDRGAQALLHLPGHRQLDACLVRCIEHEVDVLLHQRRRECGGEVVAQKRLGLVLDERRTGRGAPHHLEQRGTVLRSTRTVRGAADSITARATASSASSSASEVRTTST